LLHITQIADRVGEYGGTKMEEGVGASAEAGAFYPWRIARLKNPHASWLTSDVAAAGLVEAFVCRACGYTELFTKSPDRIPVDGTIVREIDGAAPEYR